ncbi:hypothetical protein [Methylobacterium tardum]|uniref:hypothetical protein n=1 Tax=Methylobacterium tardum TaxID=374432 RepID=UPI001EDDD1E9|nr:hypothetical protein [Methylobacterium tardum]URD38178.1 hypothetical protein M6G65_06865 [Methylobacterium tardum]
MSDRKRILSRIAETLGIPVNVFRGVDDAAGSRLASLDECVELLEAFKQIGDRQARRRCLSYVRAAAERSAEEA